MPRSHLRGADGVVLLSNHPGAADKTSPRHPSYLRRGARIRLRFHMRSLVTFVIAAMLIPPQTSNFEVQEATIADIHAALQARRITCVQLVKKYLDRINTYDKKGPSINAIITVNSKVLDDARATDVEIARAGITKPLECIPMVVKDNFETTGLPTTAGSLSLEGWISNRDAFQVKKIREAGAIVIAKTNMAEFAWSPVETVGSMLPGYTRNPPRLIGDLTTPAGDNSQTLSPGTGFPANTVPMGFVRGEFPSGMTFFGSAWSESVLIKLAYSYEQAANHRRPPASTPPLK